MPPSPSPAPRRRSTEPGIVFTPGRLRPALLILLAGALALTVLHVGLSFTDDPMTGGEFRQWLGAALTAAIVVPFLFPDGRVTLTEDALLIGAGRRRVPWRDIRDLEVRRVLGVRHLVVRTTDGRRTTLHAPSSFLDRNFDRKVRVLTDHWQTAHAQPHP
ncbi:hypothetical protein ACWD4G_45360 [Streptomyces sp. NPDC002643]